VRSRITTDSPCKCLNPASLREGADLHRCASDRALRQDRVDSQRAGRGISAAARRADSGLTGRRFLASSRYVFPLTFNYSVQVSLVEKALTVLQQTDVDIAESRTGLKSRRACNLCSAMDLSASMVLYVLVCLSHAVDANCDVLHRVQPESDLLRWRIVETLLLWCSRAARDGGAWQNANMQARIAADHIEHGHSLSFDGALRILIVRVFDKVLAL
jgi:hypothetical protein